MAIRKWASQVGGVYIKEDQGPEYRCSERAGAPSGESARLAKDLKLISLTSIHILMGIQEVSNKEYGSKERLTSLQLHNRDNAPDEWETKALKTLEGGSEMVAEAMPKKNGHGLMRVMMPMRMEEECLECHRETLVPVGGLRGAAAVSIDLNTYWTAQEADLAHYPVLAPRHLACRTGDAICVLVVSAPARHRACAQDQQRRENEAAFSAMAEGAIITDAHGDILWVNDAFCNIYGYTREEVIGQNPRILKSGRHDNTFYRNFGMRLGRHGRWRGEVWNRRKNGEIFPRNFRFRRCAARMG